MADGTVPVTGVGGWRGALAPAPDDPLGDGVARYLVRPDDGGIPLLIPAALFARQGDGGYTLPLGRDDARRFENARAGELAGANAAGPLGRAAMGREATHTVAAGETLTVPVVEETLRVGKRTVETGRVRVVKTVQEREEVIDEPLTRDEVSVERFPINRTLAGAHEVPQPRREGDTMIVPVVEEVIVYEKRLVLKEELHITRRTTTVHEPVSVTVRREEARIERVSGPDADEDATLNVAATDAATTTRR